VASKVGVVQEKVPGLQLAAIRQGIAALCFLGFFIVVKKQKLPTLKQLAIFVLIGFLMFVCANGLSTWSLKYIPTGLSALLGALYPLSVVLIERVFFAKKNTTPLTYAGMIIGVLGVGIVFYKNAFIFEKEGAIFGVILATIAMLGWSVATIFVANNKLKINPYYALGWQMLLGSCFLFLASFFTNQHIAIAQISKTAWLTILFLVIMGSIIAFAAFIYSVKVLPVAISSLYAYINPLVAMVVDHFYFGAHLTTDLFIGAFITLVGVYIVNYSIKRNDKKVVEEAEVETA
jgi:drug/metabolite transporter (DMT)-like permease